MRRLSFKQYILIAVIITGGFLLTSLQPAFATNSVQDGIKITADEGQLPQPTSANPNTALQERLGLFINALFGVLGAIFLTVVLVGGYVWLTAGGNDENVAKGKGWIINGINGILVIFLSYALVFVILNAIGSAAG